MINKNNDDNYYRHSDHNNYNHSRTYYNNSNALMNREHRFHHNNTHPIPNIDNGSFAEVVSSELI